MDQREERELLEWIYQTAKKEYERIDHILFQWDKTYTDCYGANITLHKHELIAYQRSLLRIVGKIRRQLSKSAFEKVKNSDMYKDIAVKMPKRVENIKYQMHENPHSGIFAWELAKEMIDIEENMLKKIRNQW